VGTAWKTSKTSKKSFLPRPSDDANDRRVISVVPAQDKSIRMTTADSNRWRANDDPLSYRVIGAAIEVHRFLGPGLLESAYEECLCLELSLLGIPFERQVPLPIVYKSMTLLRAYKPDLLIDNAVIVELKTIEKILPVHEAQLLTYLRLSGLERALLFNFNSVPLKSGIRRLTKSIASPVSPTLDSEPEIGISTRDEAS
jgi:GxxExxY protein